MPTSAELTTLSNCSKKWETPNSHSGYTFYTDYGSVFLPAAGSCLGTVRNLDGESGYYWSSTPDSTSAAWYLTFRSGRALMYSNSRYCGLPVRAVRCD